MHNYNGGAILLTKLCCFLALPMPYALLSAILCVRFAEGIPSSNLGRDTLQGEPTTCYHSKMDRPPLIFMVLTPPTSRTSTNCIFKIPPRFPKFGATILKVYKICLRWMVKNPPEISPMGP